MTRLIIYTAIMLVGIALGKKGFLENILKNSLGLVQNVIIFLLLFVIGVGIGKNKSVTDNLSSLGFRAAFMASVIIISSVFSVKIYTTLRKKFIKRVDK